MQKHSLLFLVAILCYITLSSFLCGIEKEYYPFTVYSVRPGTGYAGDTITITGDDFLFDSTGEKYVTINNRKIPLILTSSDSLKFIVPFKAGTGKLRLHLGQYDNSTEGIFVYQPRAIVTTIAGTGATGNKDGAAADATFNYPAGIAVDNQGWLYVADCYNQSVRKISTTDHTVSSIALPSNIGGSVFNHPFHLALDKSSHNLYLTGMEQNVLKATPANDFSVIYEEDYVVTGIAAGSDDHVYISVPADDAILKISSDGRNRFRYRANYGDPAALFFDWEQLTFSFAYNSHIRIDRTDFNTSNDGADGWGFVKDSLNNVYVADPSCNCIRKYYKDLRAIITIAGNATAADIDGIGLAASFDSPRGMTIDKDGNLYITTYNTTTHSGNKIRKISFE